MVISSTYHVNHKDHVDGQRDEITKWFAEGAGNSEVAERLQISTAALQRHTMYWDLKKIPKRPVHQKTVKPEPCSDEIRHLALHAKWTKAAY